MRKVLFLAADLTSGGAERQMVTIAALLKEHYEVEFVCYSEDDFFYPILQKNDIPVHWLIEDNYLKRIIKIRQFIRSNGYSAVISFLSTPNFLNNIAALGGANWKVITGERSAKDSTFNSRRGKVFAWFQRNTDTMVCNSLNAANMWKEHYPEYKHKVEVVYNSVILPTVESSYTPRRGGKTHIIIPASYRDLKNSLNVVKALTLLSEEEKSKIHISWYGRFPTSYQKDNVYHETAKLIEKKELNDVITLNDATPEIIQRVNEADIVGLFSWVEGLPNAICEGMSLAKPIIMTRVSDYDRFVTKKNGLLCDWDDINSIKESLRKAINLSNEDLSKMGIESKRIANELFSQKVVTNQWVKLIES